MQPVEGELDDRGKPTSRHLGEVDPLDAIAASTHVVDRVPGATATAGRKNRCSYRS